jgi:DNA-directed RNA polymerase beta' subunit
MELPEYEQDRLARAKRDAKRKELIYKKIHAEYMQKVLEQVVDSIGIPTPKLLKELKKLEKAGYLLLLPPSETIGEYHLRPTEAKMAEYNDYADAEMRKLEAKSTKGKVTKCLATIECDELNRMFSL